jgi:hypothetical protein
MGGGCVKARRVRCLWIYVHTTNARPQIRKDDIVGIGGYLFMEIPSVLWWHLPVPQNPCIKKAHIHSAVI